MNLVYNEIIDLLKSHSSIISIALGGSRSRDTNKPDSDYDIFVLLNDNNYELEIKSITKKISLIKNVIFFGKDKYLEDWGIIY